MRTLSVYDTYAQAAKSATTMYPFIITYPEGLRARNGIQVDAVKRGDEPAVYEREFVGLTTKEGNGNLRSENPTIIPFYLNILSFKREEGMVKPGRIKATGMRLSYCPKCDVAYRVPLSTWNFKSNNFPHVKCGVRVPDIDEAGNPKLDKEGKPLMRACGTALQQAKGAVDPMVTAELVEQMKALYSAGPTPENTIHDLPRFYTLVPRGKALWKGTAWEELARQAYHRDRKDLVPYAMTSKIDGLPQPSIHIMSLPPVCGWVSTDLLHPAEEDVGYYMNYRLDQETVIR